MSYASNYSLFFIGNQNIDGLPSMTCGMIVNFLDLVTCFVLHFNADDEKIICWFCKTKRKSIRSSQGDLFRSDLDFLSNQIGKNQLIIESESSPICTVDVYFDGQFSPIQ